MNITIITGASSGIGREFAVQLDGLFSNMDEIWLVARRKERLEELRCRLKRDAGLLIWILPTRSI